MRGLGSRRGNGALPSLVLQREQRNGNTTLTLLWSHIDVLEGGIVALRPSVSERTLVIAAVRGSLTVVGVTNGTDVYVWLCAVKLSGHCNPPSGTNLGLDRGEKTSVYNSNGANQCRTCTRKVSVPAGWIRTSDVTGMSRVLQPS